MTTSIVFSLLTFYSSKSVGQEENLPKVGIGLGEVNYFLDYIPFSDAMKCVRWVNVASWDSLGFPTSAQPGESVIGRIGINNNGNLPSGEYVLTWEGSGEVMFYNSNFTLISEDVSGSVKRRVYDVTPNQNGIGIRILSFPATNIKLWIPGLENHASLWNPAFICYLSGFQDGVLRTMDLGQTNHSQQTNWQSRTPRNWSTYVNRNNLSTPYDVVGGVSYEAMIELANELSMDLWICIPHEADSQYIHYLGHLMETGVDLSTGDTTTVPLDSHLHVWLEYSNEIWNWSFTQTHWVNANCPGQNLDEKYAHKAREIFLQFQQGFSDSARLTRIIGTHTASPSRAFRRLSALNQGEYDALAITTYFRYDYAQYIYDHWNGGNLSHNQFYTHIDSFMGNGPFQTTEQAHGHQGTAYAYEVADSFQVPVVSYEGNEHFNLNRTIDTDQDGDLDTPLGVAIPAVFDWMYSFCRSHYMYLLLTQYQSRHDDSGLQTHVPYVAMDDWDYYGQWGFAEYLNQPIHEATKYRWLHDYYNLRYPNCDSSTNEVDIQLQDSSLWQYGTVTQDTFGIYGTYDNYEIQILREDSTIYQVLNPQQSQLHIPIPTLPNGLFFLLIRHTTIPSLHHQIILKE